MIDDDADLESRIRLRSAIAGLAEKYKERERIHTDLALRNINHPDHSAHMAIADTACEIEDQLFRLLARDDKLWSTSSSPEIPEPTPLIYAPDYRKSSSS